MIKLKLLLLLTVCIAIACSENKTKRYERFLTNGNKKEWVFVRPLKDISEDPRLWYSYVMGFKADHGYYYYYLSDGKKLYPDHPMDGQWTIEGDGILVWNNRERVKIEYLNEDVFIINGSGDDFIVYKSKELYAPIEFRRPWSPLPSTNFPF